MHLHHDGTKKSLTLLVIISIFLSSFLSHYNPQLIVNQGALK
jgi:hypothetical protein